MKKILLYSISLCCLHSINAQSGQLDPSFGNNGITATDMGSNSNTYNTTARQVLLSNDGSGSMYILLNTTLVSKRLSNGAIDSSYGFNGYSKTVALTDAAAALQADGKIVITGYQFSSPSFIVARIDTNGTPDSTFGTNGIQTSTFAGTAIAKSIAITSDGKIVIAGLTTNNTGTYFALASYNSDGSRDTSFNLNGLTTLDFPFRTLADNGVDTVNVHNAFANAIAVQQDGKILVAGGAQTVGGINFAIARFNSNGLSDSTFGVSGKQTTSFGAGNSTAYSTALQTNGNIVLAGYTSAGSTNNFAVARYNTNGTIDSSFNGTGKQIAAFHSDMLVGNTVAIQSNGKIVVAGYTLNGSLHDFALARFNTDGSFDDSFGGSGMVTTDIGSTDDYAGSVVVDNNNKIVVAGYAINSNAISEFVLTRYGPDGSADATFAANGKLRGNYNQGNTRFNATILQTNGKIIAAGRAWNGTDFDFAIVRYNADGSPDSSFGENGLQMTDFGATDEAVGVALQSDGKIVVAGNSGGDRSFFAVARYNADGSLDNTFSGDGKLIAPVGYADNLGGIKLQPDGKVVLAGYTFTDVNYDSAFFAVERLTTDGKLDNTFNSNGKQLTEFDSLPSFGSSLAIQNDGKIVVAGRAYLNGKDNFALARYNTDGSLDSSFSADGKQNNTFGPDEYFGQSLDLQNDGKIVVAGYTENESGSLSSFAVARYQTNGDIDNTFGGSGFKSIYLGNHLSIARSVVISDNGKIALGGAAGNYTIVLYNSDGSLDGTFGDNGVQTTYVGLGASSIQALAFSGNQLYAAGSAQFPGTFGVVAKYLVAGGGPLAVNLLNFTATLQNSKTVLLNWQTAAEQNLAGFTVEKSSTASGFTPIGYVTAKGITNLKTNYVNIDIQPLQGNNFYRLKMADIDGSYSYSKIAEVTMAAETFSLHVSPNPAKNRLLVKASGYNENGYFIITNSQGEKLTEIKAALAGETSFSIDISFLPRGIYTLQLQTSVTTTTRRFIKE